MSGHSHWAGIKHKKAANDAKRGKLWSKLARNIIATARQAGPDPDANLALRYAIEKAKVANMPKDTIEKAIKRATGNLDGVNYENVLYEGYGTNGVAVMCAALTDNRNRTAAELRKIFEKTGGALGQSGCVAWIFSQKGLITVGQNDVDEADLMEVVIDAGADDFHKEGDAYEITCSVGKRVERVYSGGEAVLIPQAPPTVGRAARAGSGPTSNPTPQRARSRAEG